MKSTAEERNAVQQYLLGLLPAERLSALEERLLTDEAFFNELLIAEDELIDRYLAGQVYGAERESFESHFLQPPERRKKLRFARTLRRCVAAKGAGEVEVAVESSEEKREAARPFERRPTFLSTLRARSPAFTGSMAAAALLLLLVGSWVWMSSMRPSREPRRIPAVTLVTLSPGLARGGGEVTKVKVGADSEEVQFRLRLEGDEYRSYSAALLSAEGSTVMTDERLIPEPSDGGEAVVFHAPARALPPGDYQLKLKGVNADGTSESVGSYPFRVLGAEH
jgi:anti-sigma factor RsiW